MRLLFFTLVLLASTSASAQSPNQAFVLAAAGVGGGVVLVNVAFVVPAPVTFPVGVGLGVYGAARLMGMDASLRNTLGDAASGMLVGAAAGGVVYLTLRAGPLRSKDELSSALYGIGIMAASTVAWTVADVRVAPAVGRGPEGEPVAGASLHIGF